MLDSEAEIEPVLLGDLELSANATLGVEIESQALSRDLEVAVYDMAATLNVRAETRATEISDVVEQNQAS